MSIGCALCVDMYDKYSNRNGHTMRSHSWETHLMTIDFNHKEHSVEDKKGQLT